MLNLPRWGILIIDLGIALVSISMAYMLRFNFNVPGIEYKFLEVAIPLILSIRLISFFVFRTYAGIIYHTSLEDAKRIFSAVTVGSILFLLATPLAAQFVDYHIIPYSIIIIDYLLTMFLMLAFRVFVKILYLELTGQQREKRKVIIFGAGSMGVTTKHALDRDKGINYSVAAFVDDDEQYHKKRLQGADIFPSRQLPRLLQTARPDMVILSTPNISTARKQEVVDNCLKAGVKVLNVPPMEKWINGELSFRQIREIRIEDLLERDPIRLDYENIERYLQEKVVLVTGAAGSIGSEIARQIMRFHPKRLYLLDQAETPLHELGLELAAAHHATPFEVIIGDVRDTQRMEQLFAELRPAVVFHAAAYKHVPMMEHHPAEAVRANISGTRNMADLSVKYGVKSFVLVSTDKAVNPSSMMGTTKRVAEMYVQALDAHLKSNGRGTRFITTRFGNVLGSNGSVIPLFKKQIAEGGPVTVTHPEITRYFMTIPEACQLVLEAGAMGQGGEIFVFDMGRSIKILDLAKKMIRLSGLELGKDIHIVFTGLRPGEKLYEELLNKEATTLPTHHKKILIAKVEPEAFPLIKEKIESLEKVALKGEREEIILGLKEMVPEYSYALKKTKA
jgi:FlaA1/EpsC-like NDP-sugar epimerase